MLLALKPK